jgi:long-chain acyl-CoA synthetase
MMIITKGLIMNAKNEANQLAIMDENHRYTYRELAERTALLKQALKRAGIQKGDRVGILMLNSFRYVETSFAITAMGAISVPLNIRLSAPELEFVMNDSEIKILFIHREFLPLVPYFKAKVPSIQEYILAEDPEVESELTPYEQFISAENATALTYDNVEENDVASLFYTGGTTGRSKGVMLTHRNVVSNVYHTGYKIKYSGETNYLHSAPMFHLADGASTIGVTWSGGTHSFVRMFTPKAFLEAIKAYRPTMTMLVPTMLNMVINDPDFDQYDLGCLEKIVYGASPMPVEILKKAAKVLPGIEFFQGYGMTEASPVLTMLEPKYHVIGGTSKDEQRLSSAGKSVIGVEVRVVDLDGNDVSPGEVGEIIARGPNIMKGYWNLPQETEACFRNGWYHSGDMAMVDEDNFIYIVDRKKDMIITGGENVYSVEVEDVIYRHPDVLEAAVIGVPDPTWGEAVKAIVVKKSGSLVTEQDIITHAKAQLANYKVPKTVDFIEELPKSGAGKILKRSLRDKYWVDTKKQVN